MGKVDGRYNGKESAVSKSQLIDFQLILSVCMEIFDPFRIEREGCGFGFLCPRAGYPQCSAQFVEAGTIVSVWVFDTFFKNSLSVAE